MVLDSKVVDQGVRSPDYRTPSRGCTMFIDHLRQPAEKHLVSNYRPRWIANTLSNPVVPEKILAYKSAKTLV